MQHVFLQGRRKHCLQAVYIRYRQLGIQLGKILTKEVSEHYKFLESDFQSSYILEKMLNSFKEKESKWYSFEKGKQMLQAGGKKMESLRVTALSINYQEHLNYTIEFNENEIQLRDGQQTKSVSGQFKQQPSSNGHDTFAGIHGCQNHCGDQEMQKGEKFPARGQLPGGIV